MTRLCTLITARYNWKLDEFCVGQREMARMWNVNERTVKREIKRWIDNNVLICKRRGVRGRVGAYRLNLPHIFRMSEQTWSAVGPDFADRMRSLDPAPTATVVKVDFAKTAETDSNPPENSPWHPVLERLRSLYPDKYPNWFAPLRFVSDSGGRYTLAAESRFVAQYVGTHFLPLIAEAVEAEVGPGRNIVVMAEG